MLTPARRKTLQILVILIMILLALLLLFGLAFNTKGLTGAALSDLGHTGPAPFFHMGIGLLVGLGALINMILSLRSGERRVQVFGTLAFASILIAGSLGLVFISSGFRDTALLLGLVPLFVLAVVSYILELVFLRAPSKRLAS